MTVDMERSVVVLATVCAKTVFMGSHARAMRVTVVLTAANRKPASKIPACPTRAETTECASTSGMEAIMHTRASARVKRSGRTVRMWTR